MTNSGFPPFEEAFSVRSLHRAMMRALKGHRSDEEATAFLLECGPRLCALSRALLNRSWRPAAYRTFPIRDPKPRMVAVVDFADRVVHHALVAAVEPAIDPQLDPDSFACRRRMGLHRCVERAQELLRAHPYHLGLDIEGYFREIPHETLLAVLRDFSTPDGFVDLFRKILLAEEGGNDLPQSLPFLPGPRPPTSAPWSSRPPAPDPRPLIPEPWSSRPPTPDPRPQTPDSLLPRGMCIGALTSQFLGNVGLHPVEVTLRSGYTDIEHVRYMDDILVFGESKARLWRVHAAIQAVVEQLGLRLKPKATRLAPATEGLSFCGYRVFRGTIRLNRRSLVRLGRRIASTERGRRNGMLEQQRAESSVTTRLNHAATADTLEWRKELVRRLWP